MRLAKENLPAFLKITDFPVLKVAKLTCIVLEHLINTELTELLLCGLLKKICQLF